MAYRASAQRPRLGPAKSTNTLDQVLISNRKTYRFLVSPGRAIVTSLLSAAFRDMPDLLPAAAPKARLQMTLVGGADHFYTGMHADLWARLEAALRRVL